MLSRLPPVLQRLARSQDGVTIIEYGLLVAAISAAAVAALNAAGQGIQNVLGAVLNALT
jgi:Flp pilus assembly pilin Flp